LGAKPRQQAVGHLIGIVAGAIASTPLFFALFLSSYKPGDNLQAAMAPDGGQFGFPGAVQWKGVSELVTSIFGGEGHGHLLTPSFVTSMIFAGVVGFSLGLLRIFTKGKFPLSPFAIGLGVVVPPASPLAMFMGAAFSALMHRRYAKKPGTT